jgi:phosphoribosylformylglycinamidine cyclo-ligase
LPDEISPTPDSTPTQDGRQQQPLDTAPTATAAVPRKAASPKRSASSTKGLPGGVEKAPAKKSISYADAGVDITSGDRSKQRIKMLARKTFNKQVLSEIGGFGGLFGLDLQKFPNPVLVSSCDGVGTKLKVAFDLGIHHTVGQDLVNHCVNDIAVQGATPLFFLDYLASSRPLCRASARPAAPMVAP